MKHLTNLILGACWVAGIVIAQGFWSTLLALVLPLWAWYLLAEKILLNLNLV